jgi:hypothetical protein
MPALHASNNARVATQIVMSKSTAPEAPGWFGPRTNSTAMTAFGLRLAGGGAHQSKTMMLQELEALLAAGLIDSAELKRAVIEDNALGKATATTRILTYRHLASLYSLSQRTPIFQVLSGLWKIDRAAGHRLLALLVALGRDPLLRDTAAPILAAAIGEPLPRTLFETTLTEAHSGRLARKRCGLWHEIARRRGHKQASWKVRSAKSGDGSRQRLKRSLWPPCWRRQVVSAVPQYSAQCG